MSTIDSGLKLSGSAIAINIVLALVKIATGIIGNSYALIADGIESTTDIVSSLVVWGGLRISLKPPDKDHPYGHGKAESIAGTVVALSLLGAAVALKRKAHLGMDYFVERLTPQPRRYVEAFAYFSTGLFSLSVMMVGGLNLVARKLHLQETSPALGLDLGYVYLALPISGFFLTIYSIELLIGSLAPFARGTAEPPTKPE